MSAPNKRIVNLSEVWVSLEQMNLSEPADGVALNPHKYAYAEKRSAANQAETWNEIFKDHPKYAPAVCGYRVGAADKMFGRSYPVVWVAA